METVKRIAEESIVKDEENREQTKENKELQMHEKEEKEEREPKTGVYFPVQAEGKQLMSIGLRRKKVIALHINVYAFGIYADDVKLREILKSKFKAPKEPATKEIFDAVIDADAGIMVRLVIAFGMLSMSMVRKNFDEGIGASLKKLNGGKTDKELVSKIMGSATDNIKLPSGSVIEISRLPGYVLQTKVKGEVISVVESELLCRAYFHLYLGDDPFDKEAKDKFGCSLLSLFSKGNERKEQINEA